MTRSFVIHKFFDSKYYVYLEENNRNGKLKILENNTSLDFWENNYNFEDLKILGE